MRPMSQPSATGTSGPMSGTSGPVIAIFTTSGSSLEFPSEYVSPITVLWKTFIPSSSVFIRSRELMTCCGLIRLVEKGRTQ